MASALDKLSKRERFILALVVVVVVGVGYLNFVYDPMTKKLMSIDNQIAQVQGEIGSFQQAVSGLRRQNVQQKIQMTRGEIVRIQDEMQFFQSRMSGQVQDVIGVLKRQAALHGIKLKSINSEESKAGGRNLQYRKVEITLKMESGYNGIGNFIQALEEVPAIIAVENLEVVREPQTLPRLKTSLTLRLFVI